MSGRRRRDDGWDDGRRDDGREGRVRDAQDGSRPGPWLDGSADDQRGGGYPAPSFQPLNSPANGYGAANGSNGANGYGASGDYGSSNGYAASGNGSSYGSAANGGSYGSAGTDYDSSGYGTAGSDYGQDGYGTTAVYAARGGGSAADYNQSGYGSSYATEFMPADADDAAYDAQTGTPRPIGRLSIYTLLDDKTAEFDRIAERAAEGVRSSEPDTLVYVIHVVPKAPMQRIIYEIYRDRAAFESHERQPHIQRFMADRASCVLATNIIDLRLKYAKVAALGGGQTAGPAAAAGRSPGQEAPAQWESPALSPAAGGDQYRAQQYTSGQYGGSQYGSDQYSSDQYSGGQYGGGQYAGDQSAAATRVQYPAAAAAPSFTQADDRYAAATSQYAASATAQYAASGSGEYAANGSGGYPANESGQYAASGSGQYAANSSGRYDAAGSGQYASVGANAANGQYGYTGGYDAVGGQSPTASAYPATSAYTESGGYPGATAYQPAVDYAAGGGYAGRTGYSAAAGYQANDGYPSANGQAGSTGYAGTASGAYFTPAGSANGQYLDSDGQLAGALGALGQPAGGQAAGGQAAGGQQTGSPRRYRELGPAPSADAGSGSYQAAGDTADGHSGRDYDYAEPANDGTAEWAPPASGYSSQGYR